MKLKKNWRGHWAVALVVLVVAFAGVAKWRTSEYVASVVAKGKDLSGELESLEERARRGEMERAVYKAVNEIAADIEENVQWESDSTNLLRWCDDREEVPDIRLVRSQVIRGHAGDVTAAGGELRRIRLDLLLEGEFAALARYVDRVERSPHPMLLEQFAMTARRGGAGLGELRLVVSCLCPVNRANEETAAKQEQGGEAR